MFVDRLLGAVSTGGKRVCRRDPLITGKTCDKGRLGLCLCGRRLCGWGRIITSSEVESERKCAQHQVTACHEELPVKPVAPAGQGHSDITRSGADAKTRL